MGGRDIFTNRHPVAPGKRHGNAGTSSVSADTVRSLAPFKISAHSQTQRLSHTLASSPSTCFIIGLIWILVLRFEVLCAFPSGLLSVVLRLCCSHHDHNFYSCIDITLRGHVVL